MYDYLDLYQVEQQQRDLEATAHRDPRMAIDEVFDNAFDTLDLDDGVDYGDHPPQVMIR